MYCRRCDYPLFRLESHNCPECGQEFDPGDPRSYLRHPARASNKRNTYVAIGVSLVAMCVPLMQGLGVAWVFVVLLAVHLVISLVLSSPLIVLGRRRARWMPWEWVGLIIPFYVWASCMVFDGAGKSLSNLFSEFVVISLATPLAVAARLAFGARVRVAAFFVLLLLLCSVAIATYILVPGLPE